MVGVGSSLAADLVVKAPPTVVAAPSSDDAYQLNLLYTGEFWNNLAGGLRLGPSYMNNIDGRFSVDTEKAFGWTGGQFVFESWYTNGVSTGNSYVGAVDQQSPIDTAANLAIFRIYQLYYDQTFGNTDIRFGVYDLETEFANTKPMALFLSKNLTWATALDQAGTMPQNGLIGPGNYPYTPLALRVEQKLDHDFSVKLVIADGAADNPNNRAVNSVQFSSRYGALIMGEVDYTPSKFDKVMAGAWGLTSKLPALGEFNPDGSQREVYGQAGAYFGGATRLYSPEPRRGLDGFVTFGLTNPTSTNVAESLNAGLTYTGLLDSRPTDKIGVSVNVNAASTPYKNMQLALGSRIYDYEPSFEVTYRAKINDWITVQPDVQFIVHPDYVLKNDLIIGAHFEIGHLFEW
jgi:porin